MIDTKWCTEIIVSDNLSRDGTSKILEDICLKNPGRLKIVSPKSHLSMAGNWNFVLSEANGEYALLLSADDILTPDMCNVAVATLDSDASIDIVSFEHDRLVHIENGINIIKRPLADYLKSGDILNIQKLLKYNPLSINFSFIRLESKAIKLSRGEGKIFSRDLMTADFDFWIRLVLNGAKIVYKNKPKGLYRVHKDNLSSAKHRMLIQTILVVGRHREALILNSRAAFVLLIARLIMRTVLINNRLQINKKRILSVLIKYVYIALLNEK